MYLQVKNKQIKWHYWIMESWSSLAGSRPFIPLGANWLHFGFSPGRSYFLLLSRGSCLLAWIKLGSGATVALVFHAFKHAFIVCFLGWKFKTTNISPHVVLLIGWTTCNPNLAPGPYVDWELFIFSELLS